MTNKDEQELLKGLLSEEQFRAETLQALASIVEGQNTLNDAIGVLHIALEMLCAKHGDDPEVLMEAARQHIEQRAEE